MKDVKFVKGDQVKVTQECFKEQLEAEGWELEKKEPKKTTTKKKAK